MRDRKRDAIYKKLAALEFEVDRSSTRVDALMSLYLDVTGAVGKGAENLDPLLKRVESLVRLFGKAKEEQEEQAALAPPEPRKMIAPPVDTRTPPDFDDEIPF